MVVLPTVPPDLIDALLSVSSSRNFVTANVLRERIATAVELNGHGQLDSNHGIFVSLVIALAT